MNKLNWFVRISLVFSTFISLAGALYAQGDLREEDLQEILKAMQEADMPNEIPTAEMGQGRESESRFMRVWCDGRLSISSGGQIDQLSRLKIKSGGFMARGRVRRSNEGIGMAAGSAQWDLGVLKLQAGGIGMNAGYGLLIQRPGRSAGLSAGQSFRSLSNRIVGWATLPEKKSLLGLGASLKSGKWNLSLMHGQSGDGKSETPLSAIHLTKALGPLNLGVGGINSPWQRGATISGIWKSGFTNLGFEWITWRDKDVQGSPAAWLASFQTKLPLGIVMQWRLAASNSNEGPFVGGRPGVLGAWGGSGWAVRFRGRLTKNWTLQLLWAEGNGPDWTGSHGKQQKRFADLLLQGRFPLGWELKIRCNERVRSIEGWSDQYPWLPPQIISEDGRMGLALDLKRKQPNGAWFASVRSLGREGASTNGRRTLAGIRYRGTVSSVFSWLLSYHLAWGAPVDLVSAVNPLPGLVLPRHWGHWADETMVGINLSTRLGRMMVAYSIRKPAVGKLNKNEKRFWIGIEAKWE